MFLTAPESIHSDLFSTLYAPHPVMMSDPVKTQLDNRMKIPFFQFFDKAVINEFPVGVDGRDKHIPLPDLINQLPEIRPDQRFSAGQPDSSDSAPLKTVQHRHQLFIGRFSG